MRAIRSSEYLAGRTLETLQKQFDARFLDMKTTLAYYIPAGKSVNNGYFAGIADPVDRLADEIQLRIEGLT